MLPFYMWTHTRYSWICLETRVRMGSSMGRELVVGMEEASTISMGECIAGTRN
ncbi:hypothetical protein LINPERPRIM_LOCUS1467 [Linum perenne]